MITRRAFVADTTKGTLGLAGLVGLGGVLDPAPLAALTRDARAEGTGLVLDDRYLDHVLIRPDGSRAPEIPLRLVKIKEALLERGLVEATTQITPAVDPVTHIRSHHTTEHVDGVMQLGVTADVAELAVSGALSAVDAVAAGQLANAFCAIRPPGHHANNTGAEEGFCYYSNAAITARYAQRLGFERVLVIDWDYHHGNATQNAFYDDPSVLFFSAHDQAAYPRTADASQTGEGDGVGYNINAHLDCGARDRDMLAHWDRLLTPAVRDFDPDFVIVSAGFDSRMEDLLGCFDLTDDVFRRMTRMAMDYAASCCEGRLVSLLEGGYNVDGTALATAAHVETLLGG